jgi:excinuclease ABC subunit A
MIKKSIKIRGARVHNLKNIKVEIPKNKLTVVTGLSGSGKSSLAFDTIYAEGQRQYAESLTSYAKQFIGVMDKPDVDMIEGLSPTISIDQRSISHNPRSTVGTVTEIYDYLRLLFARAGRIHCPNCGGEIIKLSTRQIIDKILEIPLSTEVVILSPLVYKKKGDFNPIIEKIRRIGFSRVRIDGEMYYSKDINAVLIDKQKEHTIEAAVDQFKIPNKSLITKNNNCLPEIKRFTKAIDMALDLSDGLIIVKRLDNGAELFMSQHFSCPNCNLNLPEIDLRSFSFNSPYGACPACSGLGTKLEIDPELVISNPRLTLAQGAIKPWIKITANQSLNYEILKSMAAKSGFSLDIPIEKLSPAQVKLVLYGTGDEVYDVNGGRYRFSGVIPSLERKYKETDSEYLQKEIENYMRVSVCPVCLGKRLKQESLAVTLGGLSIADAVKISLDDSIKFFRDLAAGKLKEKLNSSEEIIAAPVLKEIIRRLENIIKIGLGYLNLDRGAMSLSGGEMQRIRLATQISSSLTDLVYILDEPSIGLHQKDNDRLIDILKKLRDLGNTVIVVEHDEAIMRAADHIIDVGPGAGVYGGEIVAEGTVAEIIRNKKSLTGQYLAHKLEIEAPQKYRKGNGKNLVIKGAAEFNLKNIDIKIPLGLFVSITGVSGSGKSTLMTEILAKALARHFYRAKDLPGKHKSISGLEFLDKVITIDQSPIGRTPRSNPATYTGVFTCIRDLFTEVQEAKLKGYDAGKFSFNVVGGRCETCGGEGYVKIEMRFLPDVYVECEECHGKRYNKEALEIHYKGKNIADVLNMTVEEARIFFNDIPIIYEKLMILYDVGLGYLKLGQPATTLSGGEAQRVKLATELSRRSTGKTLYILDEPTTGLHFDDIKRLLEVLQKLADKGNTVLIIEHNLDVIKSADWIIDLGPEGGDKGGYLVAEGTPRDVAKVKKSYTGQYLKKAL